MRRVIWLQIPIVLNLHAVYAGRQREMYTAEAPVPEPSAFEFEMAIGKPQRHKSTCIRQIPA